MAVATFLSRILGLVRETVMAATFGASGITDAFTVAYRVPNMLRDLFAEGAFSSAFVPVFTEERLKSDQGARRLLWSLSILLFLVTGSLSILIAIFAPEVVDLVTNDKFTSDPARLQITIQLVRIMAPFLVLVSLAALFMGALNSLKVFFVPSLAPAFFNIMMIASMLILPSYLEERGFHSIFSLGIGVIAGGLAQLLVQIPLVFKNKYGPLGPIKLITEPTKKIANRVGIGTIGIAATQINILITTVLATGTQLGAVSWLTYGFRLFQFPVGILSVSIAGSNLVHFSDSWKRGEHEEAKNILKMSYYLSWLTITPAFCLLFPLADQTVHLIFERGAFTNSDTLYTGLALRAYLIGLPCYGLYKIFAPSFFTLDKPQVPVFISIVTIALNIVFCLAFVPKYGFQVLALGTSLSMILNSILQGFFLRKFIHLKLSFFFQARLLKVFASGAVCFILAWYGGQNFFVYQDSFLIKAMHYSGICLIGAIGYVLCLALLGELSSLKKALRMS